MSIALIPLLPNNVLDKVWEYLPPKDVHVNVNHDKHSCLWPSEYTYILPYGTTIYELKQKLLYDEFEKFGWDSDELMLMESPCVILEDDYELNDDYMLKLQLCPIRWSDCSDNDSDDDNNNESDDEYFYFENMNLRHIFNII